MDVAFHRLAHGQLCLIPDFSRKMSIVNLQNDARIVHSICKDLNPQVLNGLEVMSPASDLGSVILQVLPDFVLQPPILSLHAPHPVHVEGQAVVQALHGLLLILGVPPHSCQTPTHPCGQATGPQAVPEAGGAGHGDPGTRALCAFTDTGRCSDRLGAVAEWLGRAQGPIFGGEGGMSGEAHAVREESKRTGLRFCQQCKLILKWAKGLKAVSPKKRYKWLMST
ncbi:uncharacterized protein LOC111543495 [Piliocolobus tephrosceles]|uniref:uncharacterized protein LOC111543495 n=1 Tax=Piliocolobus tephrosceles TaxID=591936 RepID=UPI0013010FBE|nr:uncharacterized protein LOC111543495 [Piliocolobus tephrosceles]